MRKGGRGVPPLQFWFLLEPLAQCQFMNEVARKFLIRGEVQGVGYRFFAQRAAARHQVVGYVKNCDDGTVEAFAEGPANDIEAFKHDLVTGPRWAVVDQVEEINIDPTGRYSSFRIER
jgi:acylphosphatase